MNKDLKKARWIVVAVTMAALPLAAQQRTTLYSQELGLSPQTMDATRASSYNDRYVVSVQNSMGRYQIWCQDYQQFFNAPAGVSPVLPTYYFDSIKRKSYILDIKTINGTVVFCGSFRDPDTVGAPYYGYIAYYPLAAMFAPNPVNIRVVKCSMAQSLRKMVVYPNATGGVSVVAIGSVASGQNVVVNFDDALATAPTYDIAWMSFPSLQNMEALYDVVDCGSVLAFVGRYGDVASNPLHIRLARKDSVVNSTIFQTVHSYPSMVDAITGAVYAANVNNRFLSVAYVDNQNAQLPAYPYSTIVRTIDLQTMVDFSSQKYSTREKYEPLDMVYLPSPDRLVLLQRQLLYPGFEQNVFNLLDVNTTVPYTMQKLLVVEKKYTSLARFSDKYYTGVGPERWCYQDAGDLSAIGGGCLWGEQSSVDTLPHLTDSSFVMQVITFHYPQAQVLSTTAQPDSIIVSTQCTDY